MIRLVKKTKAQHLLELHDLAGPAAARSLSRMSVPESWDQDVASRRVSSDWINYNTIGPYPPRSERPRPARVNVTANGPSCSADLRSSDRTEASFRLGARSREPQLTLALQVFPSVQRFAFGMVRIVSEAVTPRQPLQCVESQLTDADRFLPW